MSGPIDLSKLPAPEVIEPLSYEEILAEMRADLEARDPAYSAWLESDPGVKLLEVCAYRELLVRARVNDAARSVLVAFATGTNLDHLGALFGEARLEGESDTAYRSRIPLALEKASVAGPAGAYEAHARAADDDVKDVAVLSPSPGLVRVVVLGKLGDGTPGADLLLAVDAAVSGETVRPLTDTVEVVPAVIVSYELELALVVHRGPDKELVRAAARDVLIAFADEQHRLGGSVEPIAALALLAAAKLHPATAKDTIVSATLLSPTDVVVEGPEGAPYCAGVNVTAQYADE
jgi:phage-related baseplate assembly protein